MSNSRIIFTVTIVMVIACTSLGIMDGQGDYQVDGLGYYYAITGGKFPNGQTVNGDNASGGTFRYLLDDPAWGGYPLGQWNKDDWFPQNAGLALTMEYGGNTVYDNFNNDDGDYYICPPGGQASAATPGLYRGYCMSNNFDWIYAGYFKISETTTIDRITGYFDETYGFDADSPFVDYRMNIWSNLEGDLLPAVDSFTGDVFSSDNTPGKFSWGDSGFDRVYGDDYGNATDDILYLTFKLDTPITLEPGEYWFSHDAVILTPAKVWVDDDYYYGGENDDHIWGYNAFDNIQDAIDTVAEGGQIRVNNGIYAGAILDKNVEIKGGDGAVINDGPLHPAGLTFGFHILDGSDGATISNLAFVGVDLAIYHYASASDVTIEHCTIIGSIQAISNWGGSGWQINHNDIIDLRTSNGGGIGILVGDRSGGIVEENVISHNTITGVLHVNPSDGGGYDGSGIVLYADFRYGRDGAEEIKNNRIVKNKVELVSDTPEVVDVWACELTDSRDDEELDPVIFDNSVGFNDFRKTEKQILLTPENLEEFNEISRNLGDNRGHGSHPSVFGF